MAPVARSDAPSSLETSSSDSPSFMSFVVSFDFRSIGRMSAYSNHSTPMVQQDPVMAVKATPHTIRRVHPLGRTCRMNPDVND